MPVERWIRIIRLRIRTLLRRSAVETELDDEIRFHLERQIEHLVHSGTSPDAARRVALQRFGGTDRRKDECRETYYLPWDSLVRDFASAIRMFLRNPGSAAVAVLTLAVGIGASATVFSVINGVLLRPLPFEDPDSIVRISVQNVRGEPVFSRINPRELASRTTSFQHVAMQVSFTRPREENLAGASFSAVTPDFLKLFGIQPMIGRDFSLDDLDPGAPRVALISHEYWQSRFNRRQNILGEVFEVARTPPLTVIGVLPPDVRSTSTLGSVESVWVLADFEPEAVARTTPRVYGRLRDGVSMTRAQAEVRAIQGQILPDEGPETRLVAESMLDNMVGRSRMLIMMFAGAVAAILLLVIVNLSGLELARLPALRAELSIRTALGASRWRLMQAMFARTAVLGVTSGVAGIGVAAALHRLVLPLMTGVPRTADIRMDLAVFGAGLALSITVAMLIGTLPAQRACRIDIRESMHSIGPAYTESRSIRTLRDVLTAGQAALAIALVIVSALFINNLVHMMSRDLGADVEDVSVLQVTLPIGYDGLRRAAFFTDLLRRVESMPAAQSVAISTVRPFRGGSYTSISSMSDERILIQTNGVSPDYFSVFRIPLLAGRTFTEPEVRNGSPVAVLTGSLASMIWPGKNPLGQQFRLGTDLYTVIGVVRDVEYGFYQNAGRLSDAFASYVTERRTVYLPAGGRLQRYESIRPASLVIRGRVRERDLTSLVRDLEPNATVVTDTVAGLIKEELRDERFQTYVLASFGALGLFLAALGIYSVVTYSVARRTREIGVRMAMGAKASQVFGLLCRQTLGPNLIGMIIGFALFFALRQSVARYLYLVEPDHAPTYIVASIVMLLVVIAACSIPARRAMKLDPSRALRCE